MKLVAEMKAMLEMIGGAAGGKGGDWHQGKGAWEEGGKGGNGRVVLGEKYFRRCDKFDGTPAKFKSWVFDLVIQLGSVDQGLGREVREMLKSRDKLVVESNCFKNDDVFDEMHSQYKREFYSVIVSLTSEEAKYVARGILEK